jgi:hypothetical protein
VFQGPEALTVTVSSPAIAVTDVGLSATPATLIGADAVDETEVPTAFVAVTLKVYVLPFVRPATVIGELVLVNVSPVSTTVSVYEVIGVPPLSAGAANVTVAVSSPRVAVTVVGASGIEAGIIELERPEVEVPAAFVATAWNL